jgi:hypothetical protein
MGFRQHNEEGKRREVGSREIRNAFSSWIAIAERISAI